MDPDPNSLYFFLIVLLTLSAFFAGSETALISFDKIKLRHLVNLKNKKAILINKLLEEPDKLITTILIGKSIVNVLISVLSISLALSLFKTNMLTILSFIVGVIVLVVFVEITTKSIVASYPERISIVVVYPIYLFTLFFSFGISGMTFFSRLISNRFNKDGENTKKHSLFTIEEFKTMIKIGEEDKVFENGETKMLQGIMNFNNIKVKDALQTPRIHIVGVPVNAAYEEVRTIVTQEEFSRYPVYNEDIDQIIGILYAKDLLKLDPVQVSNFSVEKIMKKKEELIFIPEASSIKSLFSEMKVKQVHIAIVFDEYGGTEGLISMEDILETIVGDIQDETD